MVTRKERVADLHRQSLDYSVYFALLAKLFGQNAIGMDTVARLLPEEDIPERSLVLGERLYRNVKSGMDVMTHELGLFGQDITVVIEDFTKALEKSDESRAPNEDSPT